MARARFTERQVLETLAWQGVFVRCHRCGEAFFGYDADDDFIMWRKPEREHIHEIALGGPDTPKNCRYSCSCCHATVTNGTKATSAGSSKQRIAKVKRILNPKPSKRPMKSSGRKMPSRPFKKRPVSTVAPVEPSTATERAS